MSQSPRLTRRPKIEPSRADGHAQQFPWLWRLDAIDVRDGSVDPEYANYLASVVSNQHPDRDTEVWPPVGGVR